MSCDTVEALADCCQEWWDSLMVGCGGVSIDDILLPPVPLAALMEIECVSDPNWTIEQLS